MKSAYDLKHVQGTTAVALMKNGKRAGKIVANWSDNPAGSVCTATVHINHGDESYQGTGRAGGYGYDKLSRAIWGALQNAYTLYYDKEFENLRHKYTDLSKVYEVEPGSGNQRSVFESHGFDYVEVC